MWKLLTYLFIMICYGEECYSDHMDAEDPLYFGFVIPLEHGRYKICFNKFDTFYITSGDNLLLREMNIYEFYSYNQGDPFGIYNSWKQWSPKLRPPLQSGCINIDVYNSFAHLIQDEEILITVTLYQDTPVQFAFRNATFCVTHLETIPQPLTFKKECSPTPSKALDKALATFKGFLPFHL